jgi:hypothetical protein
VALGPLLLFATYLLSRGGKTQAVLVDTMSAQVQSALSTTDTMRLLLEPLEKEMAEMREEMTLLKQHIVVLETLLREQGTEPPPLTLA